jgi:hypothetical protein
MQFNKKNIHYFKNSINNEKVINLNFNYLSNLIENWWATTTDATPLHLAKFQLIALLLDHCKKKDLYYFDKLGTNYISAVCITQIFNKDCPKLALVVHEAFSELFALKDIKYPYEEHKKLYLKPSGEHYKNWGNGYGEITPHSDDLYEDLDSDFLSLTVCRDTTNTPTIFYFPKDILRDFTDSELLRLFDMKMKFISGKNVHILKTRERDMIEFNPESGFKFFLDFRIDNDTGERMQAMNSDDKKLIDKMRTNILSCPYKESVAKTGTFLIVANHKVLHARPQMKINRALAAEIAENSHYSATPRLLYRSKGQNSQLSNHSFAG